MAKHCAKRGGAAVGALAVLACAALRALAGPIAPDSMTVSAYSFSPPFSGGLLTALPHSHSRR